MPRKSDKSEDSKEDYSPVYWHAQAPDGQVLPGQRGEPHGVGYGTPFVKVDASCVPSDVQVFVMGPEEDHKNDPDYQDYHQKHWSVFHDYINRGCWVRMAHGGPLTPEPFANKAAAEEKYGPKDGSKGKQKDGRVTIGNGVEYIGPGCESHFPGWNDAELGWVIAGNPVGVGIVILLRLLAAGLEIREFHIVAHDRDQRWIWSFEKGTFVQEPKGLHVHFLFKIEGHGRTLGQLAEIIGVNAECLLYPSRGKYAWDNPLAYLIHAKDSDRFQYDPHDVFTLKGTSYAEQYIRRKLDWDKGAATKTKARTDHDFEWLRELAAHGQATRDEILADAEKYRIYVRHQQAIDDALALCQRRVDSERRHEFLTDKGFRKRVIFIHGREGYGKTCLAKALVYSRHSLLGWTYDEEKPLLPSGHVMERMHGFDQYIADDVKPTAFGAMGDVKLLLDPDNVSYADQRFHVDDPIIYRQLVITSTLAPFDYFGPGFYVANESPGQAIRRLTRGIELLDYKAFGDYHVLVLVPQEVEPCRVAFRRHNRRSDENDVVYMDGVIYRMVPLQVEGETVLFTTTGAVDVFCQLDLSGRSIKN